MSAKGSMRMIQGVESGDVRLVIEAADFIEHWEQGVMTPVLPAGDIKRFFEVHHHDCRVNRD